MNKNELIAKAASIAGLSKADASKAVDGVFDSISEALANGSEVRLVGFVALCGSAAQAVTRARSQAPSHLLIEVEIEAPDQLEAVITAGAQIVLLDNFTPEQVAQVVTATRQRVLLEASGGITMETLPLYAATGVDRISVGFVTHSAPAVDLFMDLTPAKTRHDA